MEPFDVCRPELPVLEDDVPVLVETWPDDVVVLEVTPGMVAAPTAPKIPSAPTAASVTPAVARLSRSLARSRTRMRL